MHELYYWSEIQGRGEFVRLVLEELGEPYVDVGRERGDDAVSAALDGVLAPYAFAPPVLRSGHVVIAQTALITRWLGETFGLAPTYEPARLAAAGIAMTIADLVAEAHDTHHPISVNEVYEHQKSAAHARAKAFREQRIPKFVGYLEKILERSGEYLVGTLSYADLAAFQIVEGLDYAFPRAMRQQQIPKLRALRDRIAQRPRITAYLTSPRRLPFNESGIFRHYRELDHAHDSAA
jgi:glutathione S-transferase